MLVATLTLVVVLSALAGFAVHKWYRWWDRYADSTSVWVATATGVCVGAALGLLIVAVINYDRVQASAAAEAVKYAEALGLNVAGVSCPVAAPDSDWYPCSVSYRSDDGSIRVMQLQCSLIGRGCRPWQPGTTP